MSELDSANDLDDLIATWTRSHTGDSDENRLRKLAYELALAALHARLNGNDQIVDDILDKIIAADHYAAAMLMAAQTLIGIVLDGTPIGSWEPEVAVSANVPVPLGHDSEQWAAAVQLTSRMLGGIVNSNPAPVERFNNVIRSHDEQPAKTALHVLAGAAASRMLRFETWRDDGEAAYFGIYGAQES